MRQGCFALTKQAVAATANVLLTLSFPSKPRTARAEEPERAATAPLLSNKSPNLVLKREVPQQRHLLEGKGFKSPPIKNLPKSIGKKQHVVKMPIIASAAFLTTGSKRVCY